MTRSFSGISIALVVCALLAGLAPLDWALLNVAIPVGSAPDAPALLFWLGALLIAAHYDAPRDPEKAARLPRPAPRMGASFLWGAGAVALALLLYSGALRGPFLGLDWTMIERLREARAAGDLGAWLAAVGRPQPGEDYVGPIHQLTWAAQYALWGENPVPYRVFNVVVHAINSAFVFRLASFWLRGRWSAPMAAALFLFSPLAVEHAVWASGRGDLLGATALLGCLNAYARYRRGGRRVWKWVSVAVLGLGLLANETLALLPAILLLGEWTNAFTLRRKEGVPWLDVLPHAALAAFFGAAWALGGGSAPAVTAGEALRRILVDAPSLYFAPLYEVPGTGEAFLRLAAQGFILMIVLLSGATARGEGRSVTLALALIAAGVAGTLLFHTQKSVLAGWRPMYIPCIGFTIFLAQTLTAPPESRRLRRWTKAASFATLLVASIWATVRNQAPWTRLGDAAARFQAQGARLLAEAGPGARVRFVGYPRGQGIHVPGMDDRHPPPCILSALARAPAAAPSLILGNEEVACAGGRPERASPAAPLDWRALDWGGRDRLAAWDPGTGNIVPWDEALLARRAVLAERRPPPSPPAEFFWNRYPMDEAGERRRYGLESEREFSPRDYGTLALSLRPESPEAAGPIRVRVEWRAPELRGTTLAPPSYETSLPLEGTGAPARVRVDLAPSLAWALTGRLTAVTVEVRGPVAVSDLELLPAGS